MWPNLNVPHSGWPWRDQPSADTANAATSLQPSGFSGQPSAFAIGSQNAITTGESTIGGASATRRLPDPSPPLDSAQRSFSTSTSKDDAGDQTAMSLRPARIDSIDSAEPSAIASILTGCPAAVLGCVRWKASIESVKNAFFSDPYEMRTTTASAGGGAGALPEPPPDVQPASSAPETARQSARFIGPAG